MGATPTFAPLGAYAARSCIVKAQWDVLRPVAPEPPPTLRQELARAGDAFESFVFDELRHLHAGIVTVDPVASADAREASTVAAMDAGAPLVVGARLPIDAPGHRVGEPDVLVRVGKTAVAGRWRYAPVDVKHHAVLVGPADAGRAATVVVQPLDAIDVPDAATRFADARGRTGTTIRADLLQLAHYWRILEVCGRAPDGAPIGGILGREERVVWHRLDVPLGRDVPLVIYDAAFAARVTVAAAAAAHARDATLPLAVEPVWVAECSACPWRRHCRGVVEDRADASLLPGVNRREWEALREVGLDTVPALADAPWDAVVEGLTDDALEGILEEARARASGATAHRRRGISTVTVRRAAVEIDVDMENVEGGAYLWGAYVSDRGRTGVVDAGYHAFVDWDPDATTAGVRAFATFWTWLEGVRARCDAVGADLAAYCWFDGAENRWMRLGGASIGRSADVEAFLRSQDWVDLRRVFRGQVVTGHATGLKVVARRLGFDWAVDDADGGASMVWWASAVDPAIPEADRIALRARLLDYNRDDVRATLHVRDWLSEEGRTLTPVR
jgi:predicted RecB family nuclease